MAHELENKGQGRTRNRQKCKNEASMAAEPRLGYSLSARENV